MTLSSATTLGQREPGSNGNEEVHQITQSSSISGASPSDCLVSYPEHTLYRNAVGVFYCPSRLGSVSLGV